MAQPHASSPHVAERRTWLRHVLLGVLYVSALSALTLWEFRERLELLPVDCHDVEEPARSAMYWLPYQHLLDWASRDSPTLVSVVAIPSDLQELQGNLCHARAYMADLLRAIATEHPAEIVIDKFYFPHTCVNDSSDTLELTSAIKSLQVPVVVGKSTAVADKAIDRTCLVRKPQLDLGSPNVRYGLIRLDYEREKMPLVWIVADTETPAAQTRSADTLSWAAVKAFDAGFAARPRIQALIDSNRHPYAELRDALPQQTSSNMLCFAGTAAQQQRWGLRCSGTAQSLPLLGKIVLIGSVSEEDTHVVLGVPMSGFELQAHYIDVLLSGSYLRDLPPAATFSIFAIFVFLIEGLPTLLQSLRPRWKKNRFLCHAYEQRRYFWVAFWAVACIVIGTIVPVAFRYLPPLAVLGDIAVVAVTRLLIFTAHATEHPLVHRHPHPGKEKGGH